MDDVDGTSSTTYTCPGCEEEVEIDPATGPRFRCPYCNSEFVPEGVNPDDGQARREADERLRADELDGVRIRQLAALRRAVYRQRSYVIVVAGGCAVAGMQLAWMTFQHVRRAGWQARPVGYVLFAIAGAIAALLLTRHARRMTHDHPGERPDATPAEPDFSTLGDGSDRWKHLNDVR